MGCLLQLAVRRTRGIIGSAIEFLGMVSEQLGLRPTLRHPMSNTATGDRVLGNCEDPDDCRLDASMIPTVHRSRIASKGPITWKVIPGGIPD